MDHSDKRRGRPKHCRRIGHTPTGGHFALNCKSQGVVVEMGLDELEAIRLADLEDMYQQDAASMMNVSRQTFGRILKSAHTKIADSLINSKILNIHGGNVKHQQHMGMGQGNKGFCICPKCETKAAHKPGEPCQSAQCPDCGGKMLREGSEHHELWLNRKAKK